MIHSAPIAAQAAREHIASKRVLALTLSAREIQDYLPAAVRERAMLSARTTYAGYLANTQSMIETLVAPPTDPATGRAIPGARLNPAQIRARMRAQLNALGYQPDPAKRGGLQDLSSDARLDLIIETQERMARGYGKHRQAQSEAVLFAYPADELYRAIDSKAKRNWQSRWNTARRSLGRATTATPATSAFGPFVAAKNDRIWTAISRFGNPYPPFDYRSGMRVRDVSASQAEALGVSTDKFTPRPTLDPLRTTQSASLASTPPDLQRQLAQAFGGRAKIIGGGRGRSPRLHVLPAPSVIDEMIDIAGGTAKAAAPIAWPDTVAASAVLSRPIPSETAVSLTADTVRHIRQQHGSTAGEAARGQAAVTDDDLRSLPSIITRGTYRAATAQEMRGEAEGITLETPDGYTVGMRVSRRQNHPRLIVWTMWKKLTGGG